MFFCNYSLQSDRMCLQFNGMKGMYVYIITNKNNTVLYTGVTNNLLRRIEEHRQHLIPGFSSRYNLYKLVYYQYIEGSETAITQEKYLKKCYRKYKEKLITDFNPMWLDLYDQIAK